MVALTNELRNLSIFSLRLHDVHEYIDYKDGYSWRHIWPYPGCTLKKRELIIRIKKSFSYQYDFMLFKNIYLYIHIYVYSKDGNSWRHVWLFNMWLQVVQEHILNIYLFGFSRDSGTISWLYSTISTSTLDLSSNIFQIAQWICWQIESYFSCCQLLLLLWLSAVVVVSVVDKLPLMLLTTQSLWPCHCILPEVAAQHSTVHNQ